jgi:ribonuclease D
VAGNQELQPQLVDEPAGVARICARAAGAGVVALDTESDSLHSYFHKLCLIQLSFSGEHVVLDPLALGRESLRPFTEMLADPGVEKVLHGADYDLRVLHRDLGARVVRLRDTQVGAQLLGEGQTGLAALVGREAEVVLDKRHQRADWGKRPLTPELLAYAAADTAYLELLRRHLSERLAALGRLAWWEEECVALEAIRWEPPAPDPLAFERIKGAGRLTGEARDRVAALHAWREEEAASRDVPPFRILHADAILALASSPPADLEALGAVPGVGKPTIRRYGRELMKALTHPAGAGRDPGSASRWTASVRRESSRQGRHGTPSPRSSASTPGYWCREAPWTCGDRRPHNERACSRVSRRWRTEVLGPTLLTLMAGWEGGASAAHAEPA